MPAVGILGCANGSIWLRLLLRAPFCYFGSDVG